jgi:broad-specificity NMP kinase
VRRVLITGMSGTGKSSVIRELSRLGLRAIDTDWDPEWERPTAEGEWIWREDRIQALLADEDTDLLVVSACVSNQGRFYDSFRCSSPPERNRGHDASPPCASND